MTDEAELREQLIDAFENADYPVSGPMELVPALPERARDEVRVRRLLDDRDGAQRHN